jgi:hypothetical protein
VCASDKRVCHARIIWDCAWMPNVNTFATVARDKKVLLFVCGCLFIMSLQLMIWTIKDDKQLEQLTVARQCQQAFDESANSVAIAEYYCERFVCFVCVYVLYYLDQHILLLLDWKLVKYIFYYLILITVIL